MEQPFAGGPLAFDAAHVIAGEVGAFRGRGDGRVQAAQVIHKVNLLGVHAGPDATLGNLLDFLDGQVATARDQRDELAVAEVHVLLQDAGQIGMDAARERHAVIQR